MVQVWIGRYVGPRPSSWDANPQFATLRSRVGQGAVLHEALDVARGFNTGELLHARGVGLWAFVFPADSGARFGRSVVDGTLPPEA